MIPTFDDVLFAYEQIKHEVHCTPVFQSHLLNEVSGADLYFKCENFQKVGAFKYRGATSAVLCLPDSEVKYGVCTHSSGNHAAALALAAKKRDIPAYIVMPENSPEIKKRAVSGYGALITYCEPSLQAREEGLAEIIRQTGAKFIHPYNNFQVISGQGTACLELIKEYPDIDVIVTPVGGGGLLSGSALVARHFGIKVYGAEPENADDARKSYYAGKIIPSENPKTIADGLLTSLGDITFSIIRENVSDILLASEQMIIDAMRLIWERMKIIIEPSSALPLAIILAHGKCFEGKRIGLVLSGGNVDLAKLPF